MRGRSPLRPLVGSALLFCGCDTIFDLDHVNRVDAPIDAACVEIGHDEDGDMVDDACDPCPFDKANQPDSDGDGIADACDPDINGANQRLYFTGFQASARDHLRLLGNATFEADAVITNNSGGGAVMLSHSPDKTALIVGFDVISLAGSGYREVGVIDEATDNGGTTPNGTACALGREGATSSHYLTIFHRNQPSGDSGAFAQRDNVPVSLIGFRGLMRSSYDRVGAPEDVMCEFSSGSPYERIEGTQTTALTPSENLALFVLSVEVRFRFMFLVTKA